MFSARSSRWVFSVAYVATVEKYAAKALNLPYQVSCKNENSWSIYDQAEPLGYLPGQNLYYLLIFVCNILFMMNLLFYFFNILFFILSLYLHILT